MKLAVTAGAMSLVLAMGAWAQVRSYRGVGTIRPTGSRSGFGNIVFPGGRPTSPGLTSRLHGRTRLSIGSSHATRLGRVVSGRPVGGFHGRGTTRGRRVVAVPYAYPVYYGGYGYGGYGYGPQQQPQVTVINQPPPPPQQSSPSVIINQYYTPDTAKPVVREYSSMDAPSDSSNLKSFQAPIPAHPAPEPEAGDEEGNGQATIYLIAYKDHSIYPALGYWIEGDTLNYITTQGSHNRASVELIDKQFSEQLNQERGVDFRLAIAQ